MRRGDRRRGVAGAGAGRGRPRRGDAHLALVPVTRSTAAMFADAELPVKVHDDGSLAAVLV